MVGIFQSRKVLVKEWQDQRTNQPSIEKDSSLQDLA
jgi:hypothetical protein